MDVGSSILHHMERHLNSCLTCLVMQHGTHGHDVTTKRCLGIAGFSPEVLDTLYKRMQNHHGSLLAGTSCSEIDSTVYDIHADNFDFSQMPQWLLIVVTEKELTLTENISAICRWYRRLKVWDCDCFAVVTAITTPPTQAPPLPLSSRIQEICRYNPELDEMRSRHRLKTFYISHWDCIENTEQVFVDMVRTWISDNASCSELPTQHVDEQHMSYSDIGKIIIRDVNQSLPQVGIFLRLFVMCVLGLLSVFITLGIIIFISKDGGMANDIRRAQLYLVSHLQARRTPRSEWGRSHTPTILTSLQIHNPHWCFDSVDNRRSVDQLEIGILAAMAKLNPKSRTTSTYTPQRLAYDINALLATFQNPHDFYDHDLVSMLKRYVTDVIPYTPYTAHAYSSYIISLCNNGEVLEAKHAAKIYQKQNPDGGFFLGINEAAISLMALSCIEQTNSNLDNIEAIVSYIRHQRRHDGSYGSIYTTALILQVYNISGIPIDSSTRKEATLSWLVRRCYGNAALKDPDVASAVLLALSGRSVLDISDVIGVDHKKHVASATPSRGQRDKYRYLAPDIIPADQLKSNSESTASVDKLRDLHNTECAPENSVFTITSPNNIIRGQDQNLDEPLSQDLELDETTVDVKNGVNSNYPDDKPTGHRWKTWKRNFADNEMMDAQIRSSNGALGRYRRNRRRFKEGFTVNVNYMEYVFRHLCMS